MTGSLFYIAVTLASITGSDVVFMTQAHRFADDVACERSIPRVERVVDKLIRFDPASLDLIGTTIGTPTRSYFVSRSECRYAPPESDIPP